MKLRAFIAIKLDSAIISLIRTTQSNFKNVDADIKFIKPENMHLTLKFLGDIKANKIDDVKDALDKSIKNIQPFSITVGTIGAFPTIETPRIIWVGLNQGSVEVTQLASDLESELGQRGFAKEKRPFSPHITIARVKSSKGLSSLSTLLKNTSLETPANQQIQSAILYKSTLASSGPIYEILHESVIK